MTVGATEPVIPSGAVTTADLYRELVGMRIDLAGTMARLEAISVAAADRELRVRALEQFRWKLAGGMLFGSAITSAVVAYLPQLLAHLQGRARRRKNAGRVSACRSVVAKLLLLLRAIGPA